MMLERTLGPPVESPTRATLLSFAGQNHECTFRMRSIYAEALYGDDGATLDDLREAVTTLEDAGRIARRVLGGAHPVTEGIEYEMHEARAALRARDTPSGSA